MRAYQVTSDDDRIGKTIVAEFSHFKDVTTMVWNEEATQKNIEAVVQEARAWRVQATQRYGVGLPQDKLVRGYKQYENEYAWCFENWAAGRLQLAELAQGTIDMALAVQPGSSNNWNTGVLDALPNIVARVFCFFTISKSGERCAHGSPRFSVCILTVRSRCMWQLLTVGGPEGQTGWFTEDRQRLAQAAFHANSDGLANARVWQRSYCQGSAAPADADPHWRRQEHYSWRLFGGARAVGLPCTLRLLLRLLESAGLPAF